MNKSELINAMAAESGLTKTDSKKALDAFMAAITKALKAGDKVSLVGFGTFVVAYFCGDCNAAGQSRNRRGGPAGRPLFAG